MANDHSPNGARRLYSPSAISGTSHHYGPTRPADPEVCGRHTGPIGFRRIQGEAKEIYNVVAL